MATGTYTVAEAAEYLGISRSLAYQLVREGSLPVVEFHRRKLVPKEALHKMLAKAAKAS